jgi:hypothetical protein
MRTVFLIIIAGVFLSGCAAMPDSQRSVLAGAAIGTGVGALVGSATGTGPAAIAVGAAIGGVTGGIIGASVGSQACYFRNKRGEIWRVPCEDTRIRAEACFVGGAVGGTEQVYCPWEKRRT